MAFDQVVKQRMRSSAKSVLGLRRRSREWLAEMDAREPNPENVKVSYLWMRRRARAEGRPFRPQYAFSVVNAAVTARRLGIERISVLEFGVAGGNGLLALESAADQAEKIFGVGIDVVGFDTGKGLPAPSDPRDVPFLLSEGDYKMDVDALRRRLTRAELVLGEISETLPHFAEEDRSPVGFASFDFDYYSSTMEAFRILEADADRLLPRVFCYFDDVALYPWTDFNGERAAITEFNSTHDDRKISPVYGLRYWLPSPDSHTLWPDKIFVAELFDHPLYAAPEGVPGRAKLSLGA